MTLLASGLAVIRFPHPIRRPSLARQIAALIAIKACLEQTDQSAVRNRPRLRRLAV